MPSKPLYTRLLPVLVGLLLLSANASAMRCGSALINTGDPQAKVLEKCGEPTTRSSRYVVRSGSYVRESGGAAAEDSSADRGRFYPYGNSEVLLEEWVYNFGPNKLMRQITFANGFVEEVRTLDYGYRETD